MGGSKLDDLIWERIAHSDTAHVVSSLHLEVALITPVTAPGVLDNPVVHAILSSITDSEHGVVDILGSVLASFGGIDTSLVVSEAIDDLEAN